MATNDDTQQGRLLKLLKERGNNGVYVYEIMTPRPNGCGISQYGARILELREQGHNIVNKKPGLFVLEVPEKVDWEKMRQEAIDKRNENEVNLDQPSLL